MKLLIAFNALCFVLYATSAVLYAFQGKGLLLTATWSVGALCWVACVVLSYKTLKMRVNKPQPC
jgi:hypothetical protein